MGKLTTVCVLVLMGSVISVFQDDMDLYKAARIGNLDHVNRALASGVNVNSKNQYQARKWTALHVASYYNHHEVVIALLEAGADVDLQDNTGRTALHYAAANNHLAVVRMLLKAGADEDLQDDTGSAALHYAAALNHPAAVKMLLNAGAEKDLQDENGQTPLYVATRRAKLDAKIQQIKALLDDGADPDIPGNVRGNNGVTPLMYAANTGKVNIVKALLDAHANVRLASKSGDTALHYVAWSAWSTDRKTNKYDIARILMHKGADKTVKNNNGKTPLDVARYFVYLSELPNIIDSYSGPYDPNNANLALFNAAKDGNLADVNKSLAKRANPNWRNPNQGRGWTALHVASYYNHPEVVSTLLVEGANKNVWGDDGLTPIYLASWQGNTDALKTLIDYCADVNLPQNDGTFSGMTPLMVATKEGYLNIVKVLTNAQANVRHSLENGITALHMAANRNHQDIARVLLQKDADAKKQDSRGRTPSNVARNKGFRELANIIDNYNGPFYPTVPAPPCQPKTAIATAPAYEYELYTMSDLYLLVGEIVVFITATLYSVLHS